MRDDLTPDELAEITGKKRAASQAIVLAKMGVPFVFLGRAVKVSRQVAQAHDLAPEPARPASGGVNFALVR